MKTSRFFLSGLLFTLAIGLDATRLIAAAEDAAWPRSYTVDDSEVMLYEPQVESWDNRRLEAKFAVGVKTKDAPEPVYGSFRAHAETLTNGDSRTVTVFNITASDFNFPDAGDRAAAFSSVINALAPEKPLQVPLDRLLASVPSNDIVTKSTMTTATKNAPPRVIVSFSPSLLLAFDGKPVFQPVADSGLEAAVNTPATLLRRLGTSAPLFLMTNEGRWLVAERTEGPWSVTEPPPGLGRIPADHPVALALKDVDPPVGTVFTAPDVVTSESPAELIQLDGKPRYTRIGELPLVRVGNSDAPLFYHFDQSAFYVLISGRWFSATELKGPWTYVPHDQLPPEFEQIPEDDPSADVRASIAGTREAEEAAKEAQVPSLARVRVNGAPSINVDYDGEPVFDDVPGTDLAYAVNTHWEVLRFGGRFYCCYNGLWFVADRPFGLPWEICTSLPRGIFLMPPSCPLYHTIFCDIDAFDDGYVTYRCYPGYYGTYIDPLTHVCVYGTGWWYPAYVSRDYYCGHRWTYGLGCDYRTGYGFAWRARHTAHTMWLRHDDRDREFYRADAGRWGGRFDREHWDSGVRKSSIYAKWDKHVTTHEALASTLLRVDEKKRAEHHVITRDHRDAKVMSAFAHDVRTGDKGELFRRSGDTWQRRDGGHWKELDKNHVVEARVVHEPDRSGGGKPVATRENRKDSGFEIRSAHPEQKDGGRPFIVPKQDSAKTRVEHRRENDGNSPPVTRGLSRVDSGKNDALPKSRTRVEEPVTRSHVEKRVIPQDTPRVERHVETPSRSSDAPKHIERREEPRKIERHDSPTPRVEHREMPKVERHDPTPQPRVEQHREQPRQERKVEHHDAPPQRHDPQPSARHDEPHHDRGHKSDDKKDDKKK